MDLVAREDHVDALVHGVLDLDGQNARMAVQILRLAPESVKPVCILQFEFGNASHVNTSVNFCPELSDTPDKCL